MSNPKRPKKSKGSKSTSPAKRKAPRKATAVVKAKALKVARVVPAREIPPSTPVIPFDDPLVGKQFSANVNCRPVMSRKGKTRQKCDRQRLVIVGGATATKERPKRKQVFAVQAGQRYTIPDREIRRDLRIAEKVRARYADVATASCDTYLQQVISGERVPAAAYQQCPDLPDAVDVSGPVDTSFDFKENGRRKPNGRHGVPAPFGSHQAPVEIVRSFVAERSGQRPTLFDVGDGRVFLAPSAIDVGNGFDVHQYHAGLNFKRHGNHELRTEGLTPDGRLIVRVLLVPEAELRRDVLQRQAEVRSLERYDRRKAAARKPNHRHEQSESLGADGWTSQTIAPHHDFMEPRASYGFIRHQKIIPAGGATTAVTIDDFGKSGAVVLLERGTYGGTPIAAKDAASLEMAMRWLSKRLDLAESGSMARKPNHHGGHHEPGDPLGVYLPALDSGEWRRGTYDHNALVWEHPSLGWIFQIVPQPKSGRNAFAGVVRKSAGVVGNDLYILSTKGAAGAYEFLRKWYANQTLPKHNGARASRPQLAPGQTYQSGRADDLIGKRTAGDGYAGEVRTRAQGCDGRTPSHIVGGHIFPRSKAASGVRREEQRAAHAPAQRVNVMTAEEGLRRMDEITAAQEAAEMLPRAPLQLGPGTSASGPSNEDIIAMFMGPSVLGPVSYLEPAQDGWVMRPVNPASEGPNYGKRVIYSAPDRADGSYVTDRHGTIIRDYRRDGQRHFIVKFDGSQEGHPFDRLAQASYDGIGLRLAPESASTGELSPVRALPAPREAPVRERPQAIFSRERFGAGGGPEPLRPRPVSRMTNADVLLRALSAPGTLFTLLQGGADTAMPGAKVLKVTAAPSMGPGGVVTIDVKEPRGRKPMRLTMRAGRPYWVWLGEVSLERPQIVPMFDPLLAPVMASSAPYAPVMAGLLQDVAVTPSPADYGLGRSRVDAYSPDGSTDRMRAGMVEIPTPRPAPLPPPPAPRTPPSLPPPPPAPAAPRGMSNEELAAEFKRLMGGGKANGGHRARYFR